MEEITAYKVGKVLYEDKDKAVIAEIENNLLDIFGRKLDELTMTEWLAKDRESRRAFIKLLQEIDGGDDTE